MGVVLPPSSTPQLPPPPALYFSRIHLKCVYSLEQTCIGYITDSLDKLCAKCTNPGNSGDADVRRL